MKITSFFTSRSILISWIKSYLLVLLILIIINIAVYSQTYDIIKNEINRMNEAMLKQMQQSIDTGLESIDTLTFQISMDTRYRRIATWTDKEANDILFKPEYDSVVEAMKRLGEFKNVSPFVNGMYIYLKNSDRILSTMGFFDLETFYNAFRENAIFYESMSFDDWYDNLKRIHSKQSIVERENNDHDWEYGTKNSIKIMQTLPLITKSESDATLVFILDQEKFLKAMNNITLMYDGWTLILNSENQIVLSNVPSEELWNPKYNALIGKTGSVYDYIGDKKVVVSYINSEISDWKYISVLPYTLYQKKINYAKNIMLIGTLFSAISGIILAFYFSSRNYYPVDELVNIIKNRYRKSNGTKSNEYLLIKQAVNTTIEENESMANKLYQQNAVLRTNFLNKLLKGKIENKSFIESAFETYEFNFSSDYFAVILFYIVDFSKFYQGSETKSSEEREEFVQFILTNIIEELVSQNNVGYMLEIDNLMTCLINFSEKNFSGGKQEMIRIVEEAQSFIGSKFNIDIKASISNISNSVFGIPEAYKQALDVMEYKTIMENDNIKLYEDIKDSKYDYHYSIENEYQLINCIKTGEMEAAKEIIDQVFRNTMADKSLSTDTIRCLMFDLSSTILKAMNEIDAVQREKILRVIDFPSKLLACENITELRGYLDGALNEICSYIIQNKSYRKQDQLEEVKQFIEENYTDVNITVSSIAEKFELTPSYLTRLYKEYTGKGILEYINICRLEAAKYLLRQRELTVKDIAVKVGYYNINAFNRMFKKHEGITPSAYKDN